MDETNLRLLKFVELRRWLYPVKFLKYLKNVICGEFTFIYDKYF